jgi:DNA polymerase-4
MSLRSLFVDFNSYFASVEQHEDPALRGRPVGVAPVAAETTSLIAASYEAKAFGVSTGTLVRDARRLCPHIQIRVARPERYVFWHHRLIEAIDHAIPIARVGSIDEVACELIGRQRRREVPGRCDSLLDRHRPERLSRQDRLGHAQTRWPHRDRAGRPATGSSRAGTA